ncbi:YeeE/YedE [Xenophilus sp. AP218F]|nr:YeeE/YedE family protein [Chromobacterium sp. ASV5]OWY41053.1 YeeE/YedE [Xenophilus sp. AP218F]
MQADWNHFTPFSALLGGGLIGLAASLLALANGRVAGISGIVGGLLKPRAGDWLWRAAFALGLLLAPSVYLLWMPLPASRVDAGWGELILAGLLVGVGTRYGAGCTSGHGVCGLARLSPRSLAATLCFMASGFASVWLLRHALA